MIMMKFAGQGLQQHGIAFHTCRSTSRCAVGWLDSGVVLDRNRMVRVLRRDVGFALWPNPFGPVSTRRSPRHVFAVQRPSRLAHNMARFDAWMSGVSCCYRDPSDVNAIEVVHNEAILAVADVIPSPSPKVAWDPRLVSGSTSQCLRIGGGVSEPSCWGMRSMLVGYRICFYMGTSFSSL